MISILERSKIATSADLVLTFDPPCIRFPLPEQLIDHASSSRARADLRHRLYKMLRPLKVKRKVPRLSLRLRQMAGKRESIVAGRRRGTEDNPLLHLWRILLYPRWKKAHRYWRHHRTPQLHGCRSTDAAKAAATSAPQAWTAMFCLTIGKAQCDMLHRVC